MCWVAMDRASKLAEIRGDQELEADLARDRRRDQGTTSSSTASSDGVLRQHYETEALDASTLLAAIFGFLPRRRRARCARACSAIADDLTEDGFVLRYRTGETDDGLSGKEGSFLICSFWLVSALAIVGEQQRARDLMEQAAQRCLAARPLRGGVRHRAPAATWATSRRPSRTWR